MPRGLIAAMMILLVFAALMLTFTPGGGGADAIKDSDNPLPLAIDEAKGEGTFVGDFVNYVGLAGPGRELLLDHLRLLAPAVRALARGLPAARAVGDLEPQGADASR